jgi:hypothetical protein
MTERDDIQPPTIDEEIIPFLEIRKSTQRITNLIVKVITESEKIHLNIEENTGKTKVSHITKQYHGGWNGYDTVHTHIMSFPVSGNENYNALELKIIGDKAVFLTLYKNGNVAKAKSCHTLTKEELEDTVSYLVNIDHNYVLNPKILPLDFKWLLDLISEILKNEILRRPLLNLEITSEQMQTPETTPVISIKNEKEYPESDPNKFERFRLTYTDTTCKIEAIKAEDSILKEETVELGPKSEEENAGLKIRRWYPLLRTAIYALMNLRVPAGARSNAQMLVGQCDRILRL